MYTQFTNGLMISCEGAVATVTTSLSLAVLNMLPVKLNVGDTWKIEFSYIVVPVGIKVMGV